jgi:hypothetical protein
MYSRFYEKNYKVMIKNLGEGLKNGTISRLMDRKNQY